MKVNLLYSIFAVGMLSFILEGVLKEIGKSDYSKYINIVAFLIIMTQIIVMILKVFNQAEVFLRL